MTAYNAKGSGNGVQEQATKYLYTSTVNASRQTAVVYPDSDDVLSQNGTTKVWTITTDNGDHVSTAYDRLGRTTSTTDQRGVIHAYSYDSAGRPSADTASSLGSSGIVDGSIRRIGTTYDDVGRVQYVTSYSDTSGTTAVNQVKYEYNGWGRVSREYQEHDGTVDASTLFVQYDYADGATGGVAKYVRLDEVTYPNGREVHYDYGTTAAIDDIMSRLATIGDGTSAYASYKYLGAGKIVTEDYEQIDVKLTYLDSSGNVTGLDRFGRVADQVWTDYGENPDVTLDEYTYTYDRIGNRTGRDNELHSAFDEDYTYDGVNRLTSSDRADDYDQTWTLDGLGNFRTFDDDGDSQTRTANAVNEITGITGGWITPSYDDAGNMISGPKPGDEDTRIHYVYDAWDRLVEVRADDSGEAGDLIAEYAYDGTNRRVEKVVTGGADNHYYYNSDWQLVEARQSPISNPQSLTSYVWSARYIDSPIVRFHDGNGDGDYLDAGDNIRYYTTDANYNVTATTDAATGDIVERYVYNAYGKATVYSPTWSNPAAPSTDGPLYGGYFFDAESGLYQARNRYYDSSLSTFISRDPVAADINLYRYCVNAPTSVTDPQGGQGEYRVELETKTYEGERYIYGLTGAHTHLTMYGNVRVWTLSTDVVLLRGTWCRCGCDDVGAADFIVQVNYKFGVENIYVLADYGRDEVFTSWFRERIAADYPEAKLFQQFNPFGPAKTWKMHAEDRVANISVHVSPSSCTHLVVTQKIGWSKLEGEAYLFKSTRWGIGSEWSPMEYVTTKMQRAEWVRFDAPKARTSVTGCDGRPLYYA